MKIEVPNKLRVILYAFTVLVTPIVAYLNSKGIIGATEVALWSAEVSATGTLAAFKAVDFKVVDKQSEVEDREDGVVEIDKTAAPIFEHLG